jgi:iron(III) transport system substrate-binding protein
MASRKGAPGLSGPRPQRNQLPRPGRFPRAWSNPPMLDGVVEMLQSCHAAVDGRRACAVRPHAATVATPGGTQMNGTRTRVLIAPLAGIAMLASGAVAAAEKLTLYCSPQIEWCQLMVSEFEKTTGIDVAMTRKSSGETFAQIRAESRNPKGDVWWGGTGDPHLQAAEEGLTEQYDSPMLAKLHDWAQRQSRDSSKRTVGIYAGALGFGYNRELLAKHGLPTPACWKDLTKPEYKGHVQMANPNSSGTAYTTLATIVQIFGEDEGFEFMKALHRNINQYTKSGSAPIKAAARGETTIGITFQHDIVTQVVNGFPVEIVSPCEGTGYEIGSMSIVKGARNMGSAKKFYDFALNADIQQMAAKAKAYQVPSNASASPPPQAPDLSKIKLIDYDFKKYGSSAERKRLLAKWDAEVKSLPR